MTEGTLWGIIWVFVALSLIEAIALLIVIYDD